LKLYGQVRPLDLANRIVSTTFTRLFVYGAHVKLVKDTGLVSFGNSLDLFVL